MPQNEDMPQMRNVKLLSVVVPCHNEQEVLPATQQRLKAVLDGLVAGRKCADYEIVYIDNGSTDNTRQVLKQIFTRDQHARVISLRSNFGYQGSISAGLFHAHGDAVVTIDADLQDPPEKIEEMISYFEQGYDLVLGVRKERSSDSFAKRFFSENYYRFLKWMGVDVVYNHGDFRLMARSLVDEFNRLPERSRFIRAMILKLESRYAKVDYSREPRKAGKTKFSPGAMLSLAFDGITSFSYMPLRLASVFGALMFLAAGIGMCWVLYIKVTQNVIHGWASILLSIFGLGGLQLFVLGIMGEYIGKLYIEVKQRPLFLVREEYSHKGERRAVQV